MSVRSLLVLAGLAMFAVGCEAKKEEPYKMPEIPAGLESKPGFGGMGGGGEPTEEGADPDATEDADATDAGDAEAETPTASTAAE